MGKATKRAQKQHINNFKEIMNDTLDIQMSNKQAGQGR